MDSELGCSGYLTKSPPLSRVDAPSRKQWRRRFFRLNSSTRTMYYYKDDSLKEEKGEIDLSSCLRLLAYLKHPKYEWCFSCVTPQREYFLAADSENELKKWTTAIQKLWKDGKPPAQDQIDPKTGAPIAPPPPPVNDIDSEDDDDDDGGDTVTKTVPAPAPVEEEDDNEDDTSIFDLIDKTVEESRRRSSSRKGSIKIPPPPTKPPPE